MVRGEGGGGAAADGVGSFMAPAPHFSAELLLPAVQEVLPQIASTSHRSTLVLNGRSGLRRQSL